MAWINSYHGDLDSRREELGWDKVEELLDEAIDVNQARCKAMLKQMVKLPAGAASSIVITDEFEIGTPLMGGLLLATPQVGQCVHRGGGAVMKDIYSIANELEMQVSNVNDLAQILYE